MKKQTTLLAIFLFTSVLLAKPVSQQLAEEIAINWLKLNTKNSSIKISTTTTHKYKSQTSMFIVQFENSGFVVIAANDKIKPILGYSINSRIPKTIKNCAFEWWLNLCSEQITIARNSTSIQTNPEWQNLDNFKTLPLITPLITTHWDQTYCSQNGQWWNAKCPADPNGPGGHAVVGCGAVSLAQILKYHSWPITGINFNTYTPPGYPEQLINFAEQTYNWSAMPNNEATSETAKLLYHCGVAVNMEYGPNASSSYMYWFDGANHHPSQFYALFHYFKYKQDLMKWVEKRNYTDQQWISLLKTDLNNNRPILYRGTNSTQTIGHLFNIDGYDNNDLFHVNWGFGGQANGYFTINNLIPNVSNYDFSYNQMAIVNIQPNEVGIDNYLEKDLAVTNYPNPFNPVTTISFSLSKKEEINLSVYNARGELVKELINGTVTSGNHEIKFNGSIYNSGVYFYKLKTSSKQIVNKMLLVK